MKTETVSTIIQGVLILAGALLMIGGINSGGLAILIALLWAIKDRKARNDKKPKEAWER